MNKNSILEQKESCSPNWLGRAAQTVVVTKRERTVPASMMYHRSRRQAGTALLRLAQAEPK